MQRDLKRACADYDSMTKKGKSNKGAFYVSDFVQIKDIITEKLGEKYSISDLLYEAMDVSLRVGFMIGYRCGQRSTRKQRAQ